MQNAMCATSDKNANFNVSKNMLCYVGISNSLCSRTVKFTIFKVIFAHAIELSLTYFSQIKVIHDISRQIEQRSRIGEIFALYWALSDTLENCSI